LQEHTNWVHSVAFSYDGRILGSVLKPAGRDDNLKVVVFSNRV
jgi:hypothetical protein